MKAAITKPLITTMIVAALVASVSACELLYPDVHIRVTNRLDIGIAELFLLDEAGNQVAAAATPMARQHSVLFRVPKGIYQFVYMTEELEWQDSGYYDLTQTERFELGIVDEEP